ncbi:MFS transporter [Sphingomonas bacterium]|uniref:MFS transporter n=1 Tax=Sphingomonas bacterium TaxID=1895847 RepID=UPI0020C6A451|nr:MFS transporter [Sphingomonas bacterium]
MVRPGVTGHLPRARLAAFASVGLPVGGALLPIQIFVPQFYAAEFGISLSGIGLLFLAMRLIDAAADPVAGALSDRTRTRFGRRRPWIAIGGLLFAVATWLLFFPPRSAGLSYLCAVLLMFSASFTMIQTPLSAWGAELSGRYHSRTRIVTYQLSAYALGLLLIQVLPTLIDQVRPDDGQLKMAAIGGFILVTLLPGLALTLTSFSEAPLPASVAPPQPFLATARLILADGLLLRILGSDVAVRTGQGMRAALIIFFAVSYMGLPRWAFGLYLLQFVFGLAAAPIWLRIGYRIGKHRAAIAGELVQVAINLGLLSVFPGDLGLLIGLTVAQGLSQGSGNLMLRAIVGDLADRHRLQTGVNRTGLFHSVFSLSEKAGTALSLGIALPLVAWFGFVARGSNPPAVLEHLKLVFALGPALAHMVSAALLYRFPLDQAAHASIEAQLAGRDLAFPIHPA